MKRRAFLRGAAGIGALTACSVCNSLIARAAGKGAHWGYEGEEGPKHWGDLSKDYAACGAGHEQSPVDLGKPVSSVLSDLSIEWGATGIDVVNNGHTIQANADPGSRVVQAGKAHKLAQFHFHHPSEHAVAGKRFPMEAHFVHAADDGALAVLGVFMEGGASGGPVVDTIDAIWKVAPKSKGKSKGSGKIVPAHLLPSDRAVYRYAGSLTTPPCSEIVSWTVFKTPIKVRQAQIETFAKLFPMNARPLQAINRRFLLGNF